MPYRCVVCGKGTTVGNKIDRRGLPKKKGGVGLKITGKSKRKFRPNLQHIRVKRGGTVRRVLVCMSCLRAGKVTKVV